MNQSSPDADGDDATTDAVTDDPHEPRVRALRRRTLTVGTVALLAALLGTLLAVATAAAAWRAATGVELHIPGTLAGGIAPLPWIALALGMVAVGGLSTGTIRQQHAALALLLGVGVAIADVVICPPTRAPLGLAPTQLERLAAGGDRAGAMRILETLPPSVAVEYVRAQLAMHDGDATALRQHAPQVLDQVERLANHAEPDDMVRRMHLQAFGDLRIDVVAALDRALNGEPMTLAGIETPATAAGVSRGARLVLRAAAAALLIALALTLAAVWRTMCGHVERIEALLDEPDAARA